MKALHIARLILISALALTSVGCAIPVPRLVWPTATPPPATDAPPTTAPLGSMTAAPTTAPMPTAPMAIPAPMCTAVPGRFANELETQVATAYERSAPSVVHVSSQFIAYNVFLQPVPQEGAGSGFFYDADGHVVTNYHVVENAESIQVTLADSRSFAATVVGQDPSTDLAVLKVMGENLPRPLPLDDCSQLRVGEFVLAIGSPFSLQRTLTLGIISALERIIESPDGTVIAQAIQTDASINPGNSGGPLLNLDGSVVGVNSQIIGVTGGSVGIGFAISSNLVAQVVPVLIARGRYPHPTLGVESLDLTPQIAEVLRQVGMTVPVDYGLLVTDVLGGGPAALAGIRGAQQAVVYRRTRIPIGGDIIVAMDGEPIADGQDLSLFLETRTTIGQRVEVTFYREGQPMTVLVTIAERE